MAIAFNSTSTGVTNNTSWSHTCSGTERILIVGCFSGYNTVTGVSYNSASLTKLTEISDAIGSYISLWYLVAPTNGTFNVVVTTSATQFKGVSTSYTGVAQVNPIDSYNTSIGTTNPYTISTTVINSNSWLCGISGIENGTVSVPSQTSSITTRSSGAVNGYYKSFNYCDSNSIVSTGSQSITFTDSGGASFYTKGVAFSLKEYTATPNVSFFNYF